MEQVFFNVPLSKLEPIFKRWIKEVHLEIQPDGTQTNETTEQIFSVQEAASFLNLSVATIYSKVSKGELPVMKRTKRLYFSSTELMNYLKCGKKRTHKEIVDEAELYLSKEG